MSKSKKNKADLITMSDNELLPDDVINTVVDIIVMPNNGEMSNSDDTLNSAIKDDPLLLADKEHNLKIKDAPLLLADKEHTVIDRQENPISSVIDENNHLLSRLNPNKLAWKVMIVDDEPDVHKATQLALSGNIFKNQPITFISAYSVEEAKSLLTKEPDIALIFLDVVMETNNAGLQLTQYIRNTLNNSRIRIIIRTGQPGEAPEEEIVANYGINDYRLKVELTGRKLFTATVTSLRAYYDLMNIDNQNTLTQILLSTKNIGIFRTSIEGKILNANLALAKMYGFDSIDELIQKPVMARYVDLKQRKQLFAKLFEYGNVKNFEIQTRHENGTIFDVSVSGILKYDDKGNPLFLEGVVEDITQRKQIRKTLIQKEQASILQRLKDCMVKLSQVKVDLQRANRVKEEFFSIMSHELRTPLSTVLTMSELLQDNTYGPLNKEQLKAVGYIEDSGNHLLSLINDILILSRIEAGKIQLKMKSVLIDMLCQDSLQFVKPTAQQKQIKLFKTIEHNVINLQADESSLTQILRHLLTNAVKFTPKGGRIKLEVTGNELDGVVQISVIDTGIGIAKDKIEYLFQPFVQLDSRLTRRYEGTGVGLSLVYKLVKLHGGSVHVESEMGKGSDFTILLPWQENNENLLLTSPKSEKQQMVKTINSNPLLFLWAENYENYIADLEKKLQAEGYQVVFIVRGEEITELIREKIPALILMDIQMSDDIKVIQNIRSFADFTHIPIIVLSSFVISGNREQCLQAGANDYLSKPVNIKKLVCVIKAQL